MPSRPPPRRPEAASSTRRKPPNPTALAVRRKSRSGEQCASSRKPLNPRRAGESSTGGESSTVVFRRVLSLAASHRSRLSRVPRAGGPRSTAVLGVRFRARFHRRAAGRIRSPAVDRASAASARTPSSHGQRARRAPDAGLSPSDRKRSRCPARGRADRRRTSIRRWAGRSMAAGMTATGDCCSARGRERTRRAGQASG